MVVVRMQDGIVITFNDITERKKTSDLIEKGYEDLKNTSKKLLDTNFQLEQSNFDLMQFASVASHDLKEPLRKIQVFGDMLHKKLSGNVGETEKEYLERIIHAANRMQKLIEDILMLSKLSNTDTPYVRTNLNTILAQLMDDIEIMVKEKNATIKIDKLPEIDALSGQMHQLFQNLVMNGLKFNTSAQPVINITTVPVSKQELKELNLDTTESYVRIIVEDNGIGFDEKYKDKIFGIFQRLNSNQFPGTGIGLAIAKKIVDNHGGVISVESTVNHGSRFIITLPVNNVRQEENVKALSN
jgi:two-component system CheB/CheR fusion protein